MKTFNEKYEELLNSHQINEGIFDDLGGGIKNLGLGFLKAVTNPAEERWKNITGGGYTKPDQKVEVLNIERIVKNNPTTIKKEGIPTSILLNGKNFIFKREAIVGILNTPNFKTTKKDDFISQLFVIDPKLTILNFNKLLQSEILGKDLSALAQASDELGDMYNKMIPDIQKKLKETITVPNQVDKNTAYKILYKLLMLGIILDLQK